MCPNQRQNFLQQTFTRARCSQEHIVVLQLFGRDAARYHQFLRLSPDNLPHIHNPDVIGQPAYAVVQQLLAENHVRLFPHLPLKGGQSLQELLQLAASPLHYVVLLLVDGELRVLRAH